MSQNKAIEITLKDGTTKQYQSIAIAAKELNITATVLSALLHGHENIKDIRSL